MVTAAGGLKSEPVVIWSLVFLFVTLQMTTTLRPILGRSDSFLTQEKKFFLQHWGESADKSLDAPRRPAGPVDGDAAPTSPAPALTPSQGESAPGSD